MKLNVSSLVEVGFEAEQGPVGEGIRVLDFSRQSVLVSLLYDSRIEVIAG